MTKHGPGWHLRTLLGRLGFKSDSQCACKRHAKRMDERGVEWCRVNVDRVVSWLRIESEERSVPFSATAARLLVKLAIRRAERDAENAVTEPVVADGTETQM